MSADMDSPMTSSPGPDHDEDDLFPDARPATPTSSQPLQGVELSPPETQEDIEHSRSGSVTDPAAGQRSNIKGSKIPSRKADAGEDLGTSSNPSSRNYKPGEIWKSKKAQEEYGKAMESLADKDFSLARFGDPFDDTPKKS